MLLGKRISEDCHSSRHFVSNCHFKDFWYLVEPIIEKLDSFPSTHKINSQSKVFFGELLSGLLILRLIKHFIITDRENYFKKICTWNSLVFRLNCTTEKPNKNKIFRINLYWSAEIALFTYLFWFESMWSFINWSKLSFASTLKTQVFMA